MPDDNNTQKPSSQTNNSFSSDAKNSPSFSSGNQNQSGNDQNLNVSPPATTPPASFPVNEPEATGSSPTQSSTNKPDQEDKNTSQDKISDTLASPVTSNTNSVSPQAVVSAPHTPEKYGGKKVIATIFGVLLLVGAVAAGVTLVQRQQQLQQQAASGSECSHDPNCQLLDNPGNSGAYTAPRHIIYVDITDKDYHRYNPGDTDDGCRKVSIHDNFISWEKYGSGPNCKDVSNVQIWMGEEPTPTVTPTPASTSTPTPTKPPSATNTPTPTSTPTPTLPPEISAECFNVVAYDINWHQLSVNDLSSLEAGDAVRFAVTGQASSGTFSKARFEVNSSSIGESNTQRPSSDEFYIEYEIPEGVSSFTVKGELYHSTLGWI